MAAKSIGHHVGLPRVVKDLTIITLHHIEPHALPHVNIWLIHQVPQTFVVRVFHTRLKRKHEVQLYKGSH